MGTETRVQAFVHRLEEGGWARWIRRALLAAAVVALSGYFILSEFRGLSHAKGIEQAQIAREIIRGHGFTTKVMRPLAYGQFMRAKEQFPQGYIPDTYYAPLYSFVLAPFIGLVKSTWLMNDKERVYKSDQVIAALSMLFFLGAVGVNYLTAKRLFDQRLALLSMGLMLICDRFWQFSMTGLPQMLMLLLFSGCTYCLVRAVENRYAERSALLWLGLCGLLFGLLALTHGITIWLFAGALIFALIFFRPRGRDTAIMLLVFAVVYSPFLYRNYTVCGSLFGVAPYSSLTGIKGTEGTIMRSPSLDLVGIGAGAFRHKMQAQLTEHIGLLFDYLGKSVAAAAFFLSLLHLFKNPEASTFRWCLLGMWLLGLFAMTGFALEETQANDVLLLFIPLMICYGLAFLLVLWTRLELTARLMRGGFLTTIYLLSGAPLLTTLFAPEHSQVQWPPYVPPFIAIMNGWTKEDEIIASDMPWGVAWYADRKSLWIPNKVKDFINLHDYPELGGPIVGLYLTPVSAYKPFLSEIVKGEFKEWAPFIMRNADTRRFPFQAITPMPIDNECIFYSDYERWPKP